jgi:hypothetical protein
MSGQTNQFFERLEEQSQMDRVNDVEQLLASVKEVFENVLAEGFDRIDMFVDADEASLTLYLRDNREIAEYELFTIHTDGTLIPHFRVETVDYHKDTIGFAELEDNPDNWFQSQFDDPAEISWEDFQDHENAFLDEIMGWIENFCVDMEMVYETDEELVEVEKRSNLDNSQENRLEEDLDDLL